MQEALSVIGEYVPADVDFVSVLPFLGAMAGGVLALALVFKLILGRKSELNHALSSALGILFIYAATIVIYTFNPYELSEFLSPLPFVGFAGESIMLFPLAGMAFPTLCAQLVSMIILAFLVNLLDSYMPKGEGTISWILLKTATVVLAMVLHFLVQLGMNAFLPGVVVAYADAILLVMLLVLLFLGLLKVLLGLVLGAIDPIIGIISAFFFSTVVGKQLSKAVLSTMILAGVVYLLENVGYTVISISAAALTAYIPLLVVLLVLWYLIDHIL